MSATPTVPSSPEPLPVSDEVLDAVAHGRYHAPHAVLGAHLDNEGHVTFRTLRHLAASVSVIVATGELELTHEHHGVWVGVLPATDREGHVPDYRLKVTYDDGASASPSVLTVDDPYRHLPTLGELDLHLIGEGRHEKLWSVLGAHVQRYHSVLGDVVGTGFAVWAPNARAVRVKGDFNQWNGRQHAMRSLGRSGVWELFIPGVEAGAVYKFEVLGQDGQWRDKADPLAQRTEVPPLTGSVVAESNYAFADGEWMRQREQSNPHTGPISVYEVHLGSWRPGLSYRELAKQLTEYVAWQGFTHVEFLPVAEHPFGGSWGYQVTGYYAPTSRFGTPDDFRYLIDTLHQAGIGVLLDWVPAHFPKDEWALAQFDGQPLYEHADPRRGEHPDWGTLIFDFGRNEVRNFLVANALYWLDEFHVDGLRVDAVASMLYLDYSRQDGEWEPNAQGGRENLEAIAFLQEATATAYRLHPGIVMIAEESTAFDGVTRATEHGGLGFGLKWNMGWMHDSLQYMGQDPVHRQYHHHQMTFSLVYAWSENYLLPISHDEVVHGKGSLLRRMPGDRWRQLAQVRAYLAFQWAHPGKQLIFMGTEFAQEGEWSEQHGLDWWIADTAEHGGVHRLVKELNALYRERSALWSQDHDPAGFDWIDSHDAAGNTLAFTRRANDGGAPVVAVANFAGEPQHGYRLGFPEPGQWTQILNTDAVEFGGSGVTNPEVLTVPEQPHHGQPASADVSLPPLGVLYFTPTDSLTAP
ncbi:alpha-1,4-glucan:alpha-1,4-glucan 6-glycosyltransferase [Zhihengliuella flava]|uniref:1,4-alpha-glucan branching enzyme GlgB n=1 Tax=Zhihengliuella flava TaxID=1285193 RepID=A0A931DA88_9MICC|nr:alpha-1,4-glucan:alpha-1,4-glucan 6-glycosyltransferase [Zhihengliuella flava]